MKSPVLDPAGIDRLKERISRWLDEQSGRRIGDPVSLPEIVEAAEFPQYRVSFKAVVESRTVSAVVRTDAPPDLPASPSPEADPWSIATETEPGFVNTRQTADLPGSFAAVPCRACGGQGRVPCPDCRGEGAVVCMTCHGDGKRMCDACKRSTVIICARCKGIGRVYNDLTNAYEACAECGGKGRMQCTECRGGFVVCPACGGNKRAPCERCAHTGITDCPKCGGKGRIVTGKAVEIVSRPQELQGDVPNDEIPAEITAALLAKARVQTIALEAGDSFSAKLDAQGLRDILPAIERLKTAMLEGASGSRIRRSQCAVEKRVFVRIRFKSGDGETVLWGADAGDKVIGEQKFVSFVYASALGAVTEKLRRDDLAGARSLCEQLAKAGTFPSEVPGLLGAVRRRLFLSYGLGALAGAALVSSFIFPYIFLRHAQSFHFPMLLAAVSAINVLGAALPGLFLYLASPRFLNTRLVRFLVSGAFAIGILFAVYVPALVTQYDPLRALDERQMRAEYRQYFPFGLPALVNAPDIAFVEGMVRKYKPAGIDVSALEKDLAWLREKQAGDVKDIETIEQAAREIEKDRAEGRDAPPARRAPKLTIE